MNIRPFVQTDAAAVRKIMHNSFAFLQRLSLVLDRYVLVAEDENGEVVGAVKCKVIDLKEDHRVGLFSWLCADPERGKSFGLELALEAMRYFEEKECTEIIGCIEGMNDKASAMASIDGFAIVPPVRQLKLYGHRLFKLWFKAFHILDFGHFLWRLPPVEVKSKPAVSWWLNFFANCLVAFLAVRLFKQLDLTHVLSFVASLLLLFGLRHRSMKTAAYVNRLPVIFRPWETGFFLGFGLAAIGLFFPLPGTLYPKKEIWSFHKLRKPLTSIAFSGTLIILLTVWLLSILKYFALLPQSAHPIWSYIIWHGKFFALWDLALPFFPFTALNGERIFKRSRIIWLLMAAAVIGLFVFVRVT